MTRDARMTRCDIVCACFVVLVIAGCTQNIGPVVRDNLTVTGRGTVSGTVVDSTGMPLAGLIVYARVVGHGPVSSQAQPSDASGNFSFSIQRSAESTVVRQFPDTVSATIVAESSGLTRASLAVRVILDTVTRAAPVVSVRLVAAPR